MSKSVKGFVVFELKKNLRILFTHGLLHRNILVSKSLVPELQKVLDDAI